VMEGAEEISGPWRATRLWNTIIRNFRSGMPLKKHKKNMRSYEACFSSNEAIEWLHKNLQKDPNFGADVTRDQTILLLKKLFRAGIIENVREESMDEEFKVSGELYKFSNKSPTRATRTPGKGDRRPLAETGNTPRASRARERQGKDSMAKEELGERDRSGNRKIKEEMKKQLNLSYFRALPSNSLIILDNDDTWRKVFTDQLSRVLSKEHTERLDYAGQLDMDNVMHNMTKVSSKGIVQVDDKAEDLPYWVLSAMKCLANWPRQLRTVNGKESCLPQYPGFEHDVFNVVKDYFHGLPGPLSTFPLYEFLAEAYNIAENGRSVVATPRGNPPPTAPKPSRSHHNPHHLINAQSGPQFYQMTDKPEDISSLTHHERVARIRQTFQVMPPLATSSLQNSNNSNSTATSGHSTFDTTVPSLSPDMSTTAIMKQFLPPNTCFETAFVEELPTTRIVPQKDNEVLHFKRSWSGRSLSHIPSDLAAKTTTSTQTDTEAQDQRENSLKRLPKWKRTSRFRKSIAVMECQDRRRAQIKEGGVTGIVNTAFSDTPKRQHPSTSVSQQAQVQSRSSSQPRNRAGRLMSINDLPEPAAVNPPIRGCSSVDNLVDREMEFEHQFMMKYRQVSGDLLSSCDLIELAREKSSNAAAWDKSIESKAVRKEKKKRRGRSASSDRFGGYETDSEVRYEPNPCATSGPHCYVNRGLDEQSPPRQHQTAPLASHEISDLSPVPFSRHAKYNASYRLATNQPATPTLSFPRTSTQISLQTASNNNNINNNLKGGKDQFVRVRAEPYLNSDVSSVQGGKESLYTCVGQGPIQRYKVPQPVSNQHRHKTLPQSTTARPPAFRRDTTARASRSSQVTVDSGRYSDVSRASGRATWTQSNYAQLPSNYARVPQGSESSQYSRFSRTSAAPPPPRELRERLEELARKSPEDVEEEAIQIFKLLTLIIPPSSRRKLQLLLKFIRKISLNQELRLDSNNSNRSLSIATFAEVILRPGDLFAADTNTNRKIVDLFLDRYEEIWTPPESLRKEVEEKVYHSLVDKRRQAGEDPYPVTYCKQVTKAEYEAEKLSGADSALLDLLQAILVDKKMSEKEKAKKLKKFRDAYPKIWRRKFPSESSEPDLGVARKTTKFGSLSRIKSVMRM